MNFVRQILTFVIAGALAGVLIMSAYGPSLVAQSADKEGKCWCAETKRQGADQLVSYQMNAIAVGSVLGFITGVAWVVWRRKVASAAAAANAEKPTTTPPPPAA